MRQRVTFFALGLVLAAATAGLAVLVTSTAFILWTWYGLAITFLLFVGIGVSISARQGTGRPLPTPIGFSDARDAYAEMAGRQASQYVAMASDERMGGAEYTLARLWISIPVFGLAAILFLIYYT